MCRRQRGTQRLRPQHEVTVQTPVDPPSDEGILILVTTLVCLLFRNSH